MSKNEFYLNKFYKIKVLFFFLFLFYKSFKIIKIFRKGLPEHDPHEDEHSLHFLKFKSFLDGSSKKQRLTCFFEEPVLYTFNLNV